MTQRGTFSWGMGIWLLSTLQPKMFGQMYNDHHLKGKHSVEFLVLEDISAAADHLSIWSNILSRWLMVIARLLPVKSNWCLTDDLCDNWCQDSIRMGAKIWKLHNEVGWWFEGWVEMVSSCRDKYLSFWLQYQMETKPSNRHAGFLVVGSSKAWKGL